MPRPSSRTEAFEVELRVTPPDQKPITDWKIGDDFLQLIVAEEGTANGTPKLHYHLYAKTMRSESWIRNWVWSIAEGHYDPELKPNGNALYFSRRPHEHTIPYVIKHRNIIIRNGFTQTLIDEYFEQSEQYKRDKDKHRKQQQRTRGDQLAEVVKQVEKDLHDRSVNISAEGIVDRVLTICSSENIRFPTRPQMESIILKLIYPFNNHLVRSYYAKSFQQY